MDFCLTLSCPYRSIMSVLFHATVDELLLVVQDTSLNLLFAGHDTSASAIMLAVRHLKIHPGVLLKLRQEQQEVSELSFVLQFFFFFSFFFFFYSLSSWSSPCSIKPPLWPWPFPFPSLQCPRSLSLTFSAPVPFPAPFPFQLSLVYCVLTLVAIAGCCCWHASVPAALTHISAM